VWEQIGVPAPSLNERAEAALCRAWAAHSQLRMADAKRHAATAVDLARADGDVTLAVQAAGVHAAFGSDGAPDEKSLALLENLRTDLADGTVAAARIDSRLAYHRAFFTGDTHASIAVARHAQQVARSAGDVEAELDARWAQSIALLGSSDIEERTEQIERIRSLADASSDPGHHHVQALRLEGVLALQTGDLEHASRLAQSAWETGGRRSQQILRADGLRWQGTVAAARGDWATAEQRVAQQLQMAGPLALYAASAQGQMLAQRFDRGLPIEPGLAALADRTDLVNVSIALVATISTAEQGTLPDPSAVRRFGEVVFGEKGPHRNSPAEYALLARLIDITVGDRPGDRIQTGSDLAEQLRVVLARYRGQFAVVSFGEHVFGSLDRAAGVVASVLGDHDEALEHFAAAQEREHACGASTWSVFTVRAAARAAARRGDDRGASELRAHARDIEQAFVSSDRNVGTSR
jgi:hypothetical protein